MARTSLWSQVVQTMGGKEKEWWVFFFFCESRFKLRVTHLLRLPGCASDGKEGRVMGFFFSCECRLQLCGICLPCCANGGRRGEMVLFSVSPAFSCVASVLQVVQTVGQGRRRGGFFSLSVSPVFKQKLQEHLKQG